MKSPHLYPCFIILKTIKPKYLVESGVFKGQGTWFFQQFLKKNNTKIISMDINPQLRELTIPSVNIHIYFDDPIN